MFQDWQARFWQGQGGVDAKGNWLNVRRDLGLTRFMLPKAPSSALPHVAAPTLLTFRCSVYHPGSPFTCGQTTPHLGFQLLLSCLDPCFPQMKPWQFSQIYILRISAISVKFQTTEPLVVNFPSPSSTLTDTIDDHFLRGTGTLPFLAEALLPPSVSTDSQ